MTSDRWKRALMWRCPLLPALPIRTWWALWGCFNAAMLANWFGALLDWWSVANDVGNFLPVLFLLLAFTPLDFSRRVVWLTCPLGSRMVVPVTKREAYLMHRERGWEVHRIVLLDGKLVEGKRVR